MSEGQKKLIADALDGLQDALADHQHVLTYKERELYQKAKRLLTS